MSFIEIISELSAHSSPVLGLFVWSS